MFRAKLLILPLLFILSVVAANSAYAIWPFDQISQFFQTDNGQTKTDALYATNMSSQFQMLYGCSVKQIFEDKTCSSSKVKQAGAVPELLASTMAISSSLPDMKDSNGAALASLLPFPQAHAVQLDAGQLNFTGAARLSKILVFWNFTRNLAYGLMIVILIVIGFMIMFRRQIDPRTVVTATSALPRIVLALVLITFSWSIAGLLMDLGNVILGVIANQFTTISNQISQAGAGGFIQHGLTAGEIRDNLIGKYGTDFDFGEGVINVPVGLVIGWVTFLTTIILVFTLAIRWLSLFLLTIMSPLSFMMSAIPGQEGVATGWFKNFMVNVLVFPLTYAIINFGYWVASSGISISGPPAFYPDAQFGGLLNIAVLIVATRVPAMLEQAFDALPAGHVQRSGVDPMALAKKMPIVGGFF